MSAAFVMVLVLTSSLIVLQSGFQAIDTARYTTLAGQILQSQMERLRMLDWDQLTGDGPTAGAAINSTTFTPDLGSSAQVQNFTCTQSIAADTSAVYADATSALGYSVVKITLTATWKGTDGRPHTLSYTTRYAHHGVSDFFYTAH
jgi:hypothetical protein